VPLAQHLISKHSVPGAPTLNIPPELKQAWMAYHWPGNVRELENVIRRFVVLRYSNLIARELQARVLRKPIMPGAVSSLRAAPMEAVEDANARAAPILEQVTKAKQQAEIEAILSALNSTRWNRKQAAALLKTDYKALLYKMKKLGVESSNNAVATITSTDEKYARAALAGTSD